MRYPQWFPYPVAWLNAFVLGGLMTLYGWIAIPVARILLKLSNFPIEASLVQYSSRYTIAQISLTGLVFCLILPVIFIAFFHHGQRLIMSVSPLKSTPKPGKVKLSLMPELVSWREGFTGWSITLTGLFVGVSLAALCVNGDSATESEIKERLSGIVGFTWLISAAYLYQLFHLVESKRLPSPRAYSMPPSPQPPQNAVT